MNWNRETLKGDFSLVNSWFKDNREKVFLHRIVTGEVDILRQPQEEKILR